MPTLTLQAKEFKSILKSLAAFSAQSFRRKPIITFGFNPNFHIVMNTDHAYISAVPLEIQDWDQQAVQYSFNPESLLRMTLGAGSIKIGWTDERSTLELKDGKLSSNLKVAVPHPSWDHLPSEMESFPVPLGVMAAITKYTSVPFSYFKSKKELMPVRLFKNAQGFLEAAADDGYSVTKVVTEVQIPLAEFDVKLPKYALDCLFSGLDLFDTTQVKLGVKGYNILIQNQQISAFLTGLNDNMMDFNEVESKQSYWLTSCEFIPSKLSSAVKPLISLLPAKDRQGTIIDLSLQEKMTLSLRHKDVGEAKVEDVDGISNIYNERGSKKSLIHMHPQAFQDYTSLCDMATAKMFANNQAVMYDGQVSLDTKKLNVKYLFPTVTV